MPQFAKPFYLAIDVGSTLSKGKLWAPSGRLRVEAKSKKLGALALDPNFFWRDFEQLLSRLIFAAPRGAEIHLGLSVQRSTLVAVDKRSGKALTKIISWQDTSGEALLNQKRRRWGSIQKITGLRPNGHYGASK